MGKYRIPAFISLQKYLMGDEGHTGVNGKARNRDGTWGTAIAISPFSDPRQSVMFSFGVEKWGRASVGAFSGVPEIV